MTDKIKDLPVGDGIASIREFLFESVMVIFCVFGFLSVIMGGIEVFLQGKFKLVLVYICAYLPVLICLFFRKKISFRHRVIIVLLDFYILSVLILSGVGLSGAGIPLLITFSVLTTTFLGIRMGIVSVLMNVAAILVIGSAMSKGVIPIDIVVMANSTRIEAWAMAATLFLVIGGVMVLCPGLLQNSLQKTIDIIQEKTSALQESNARLKKALKDREEMEEKLIRAEKMEAMGILAGGVAHDLNNILTGATTYPELLLMSMAPEDELFEPLKMIKASGDKAATIVRDLLSLSRRGVNVKTVLNLWPVVHDYLQSPEYEKLCQFHPEVSLETDIQEGLGNISGSEVHLSNVVMNLISNAAEAMPHGGRIRITGRNAVLDKALAGYETIPRGAYVTLSVSDTGSGISKADLDRIFEPFFTKKKMGRSGTGLGMAIVLGSVKDHHGYIDIHTSPDKGTRFDLYFPLIKAALPSRKPPFEMEKIKGHGQAILFADDVKEQRLIGEKVLTDLGYAPVCLDSGEKAVEFCRAQRPDLLILDMIMDPGIDGYETLKQIRKIHPNLGAVIVSGYSETDQVKGALALGSTLFLKKPYTVEDFALALHTSLNH